MNTTEFFAAVLPSEGPYHLRWKDKDRDFLTGVYLNSIDELAKQALRIDAQGHTVYYGTASYIDGSQGTKATAENIRAKRAYYLDIDVGPNKEYPDKKSAAAAILATVDKLDLPPPMIVLSGMGFHVYWLVQEDVPASDWLITARKLKAAVKKVGLKADNKVTADAARILRPVGTHHRKGEPIPVKVVTKHVVVTTQDIFAEKLGVENYDPLADVTGLANMFSPSTDMDMATEYPPSDADAVARHCAVIKEFKETGFDGGGLEPVWYDSIGVVKHCIDGADKCHEYSQASSNYDEGVCQTKIDQWEVGPTRCEHFQENYAYCEGCPHIGHITSPIQLGVKAVEVEQKKTKIEKGGPWWPEHSGWCDHKHQMYVEHYDSDEEAWNRSYFSSTKFWIETRIWTDDNTWAFRVHRLKYLIDGKEIWETFIVPTKLTARPTDLAMEFAAQEVYVANKIGPTMLAELLKVYGNDLRTARVETTMHSVMGWFLRDTDLSQSEPQYAMQADGFIIGNKLITADGEQEVLLGDNIPEKWHQGLGKSGSAQEWARTVHELYIKPDIVPYQFVILSEFAAPLVPLFGRDEYHGNPIVLVGESGVAKTSACKVGLSIWGSPSFLTFDGNPTNGITSLSFQNRLSALRNISPLLDEVTQQPANMLAEKVYNIATGYTRERLGRDGKPLPSPSPWYSLAKITSNNSVMESLADEESISEDAGEAIQKRIFEINFKRLPYTKEGLTGPVENALLIGELLNTQYGTAGPLWVRYIQNNKTEVIVDLAAELERCKKKSLDHASERFLDYLEAVIMVTCKHVKIAGLMFPNLEGVYEFIQEVRADMSEIRTDSKLPAQDSFARYLGQNYGGLMITDHFPMGKGRSDKTEFPKKELRGEMVGRIADKDQVVALAIGPLKEWCRIRSVDFNRMVAELDKNGYFVHDPKMITQNNGKQDPTKTAVDRLNLGRGTAVPSSRTRCFLMDYGRIHNKTALRPVNITEEANESSK